MTRTIDGPLAAALAASPRRGAECVILVAKDGTRAGFTTWSGPLEVDLGLGEDPDLCVPGITLSAVTMAVGLDASSYEIEGAARGDFSGVKVRGGKWRGAEVWLVRVSPFIVGHAALMKGKVAEYRVEGRRFVLEVRNQADAFNQTWGRVLTPWCTATYGDDKCTVVRTPYPCAVSAVIDDFRFFVDIDGAHPDDFFNLGSAAFLTGDLAGIAEASVADYDGDTGAVELYEPLIAAPQIGDTLNLFRGCSKLLKHDDAAVPTCLTNANVVNFRGWPEVPGSRTYLRVSQPGAAYA